MNTETKINIQIKSIFGKLLFGVCLDDNRTEITLDQYKKIPKNKDMSEEKATCGNNSEIPNSSLTKESVQKWCDENGMVLLQKDEKTGVPIICNTTACKVEVEGNLIFIDVYMKNGDSYFTIQDDWFINVEPIKEKEITKSEAEKLLSEKLGDNYKIVE